MTLTAAARPAAPTWRVSHGGGFWVIAAAFTIALAFSTVPTPLYGIYQHRDGFPTWVITVIYAMYAVGVVASLYLVGHVSDWFGRRRVILAATLVEAVSALIFVVWPDLTGLIIARLIGGAGIGAMVASATAHLSELRTIARPDGDPARSGLISTVVNAGGLAIGPLVGGLLVRFVDSPLTTPYLIFLGLLLLSALAISLVPETVERAEERPAYRPQAMSLPKDALPRFFGAATGAFAAFALMGLFTALAPTLLTLVFGQPSKLLGGIATFALMGAAAAAQVVFTRVTTRPQLKIGFASMAAGLVVVSVSVLTVSIVLFFVGAVIGGAGTGLVFRSSVATAAALAEPAVRGEVLAALFLGAYAGLSIPVLAIGVALIWLPSPTAVVLFSALDLVLLGWAARRTLAR
ncbi:MFS transporter [Actinosynnema sp. ALI-1.44]|uniref:MFS transporter n=1 Tax=Actinosynnema sp. ALI-1.44 TaxID=1933779 RepID=UPI00097C4238|nr:MFS transporter [Actinosynnema sp. ALI-1.44]ONI88933.1 MFS transporter [Actinosynnema sp. ALI-1.44]